PGQLGFGIAQGAADPELRRRSIEEITAIDFDGYALGGLAIGEPRPVMFETTAWAAELLPDDKPRYFMGIGDPHGILEVIAAGIDMFDCVLPTRTARTGSALTWEGRLNLRNARFARDERPLDESCECPACERFSRAYVRHLVNQQEHLGLRIQSGPEVVGALGRRAVAARARDLDEPGPPDEPDELGQPSEAREARYPFSPHALSPATAPHHRADPGRRGRGRDPGSPRLAGLL